MMSVAGVILSAAAALLVIGISVEYYFKRNRRRPLSFGHRTGEQADRKAPIGMEAMDLDIVEDVRRANARAEARNHGYRHLESMRFGPPLAWKLDDEDYAEHYHRTYGRKPEGETK